MSAPGSARRPRIIGVLSPLAGGFYHGDIVAGAEAAARRHGAGVIVAQTSFPWPDRAGQPRAAPYVPLAWERIDGFIIAVDALSLDDLRLVMASGKPVVTISMPNPDPRAPSVLPDNMGGAMEATRHLIDHGHRHIAFAGCLRHTDVRQRYEGYLAVLAEQGIDANPDLHFALEDNLESGGRAGAAALLTARQPCTAIFVATDRNALALMEAVQAAGRRVPEDLAIVSFDDIGLAQQAVPALSSVRQRFDALGEAAAECVIAALAGQPVLADPVLMPTALIVRHSCGCAGARHVDPPATDVAASNWHDALAALLARQLVTPFEPPAGTPPAQLWPGVDLLASALEAAALDTVGPDAAALDRVWQAAGARTQSAEVFEAIAALLQHAGLALRRQRQPNEATMPPALRAFLDQVRIQILRSSMTDVLRLDRAQQTVSLISRSFLRRETHAATDLSWLALAGARQACLAVWEDTATDAGQMLRIVSCYDADSGAGPGSGAAMWPRAFPPADFPRGREHDRSPAVQLIPLGTPDRAWGVLAVVGPLERPFHEAHDIIRHGATEQTLALEHEALLQALEAQRERLRESEERFRQVEEHAPIGLALLTPDGRWLRVNPALCALLGYSEAELLALNFQEITHPDNLAADLEQVRQALVGNTSRYHREKRYLRKDGSYVWVMLSVSVVRDDAGLPLYFISQIQDITERKQAEELARLRSAQAEAMDTIGKALGGTLEPERLYALILEQAVRLLPSDHAMIILYADGWAYVGAVWGSPSQPAGTRLYRVTGPDRHWLPTDYPGAVCVSDTASESTWVDIPPYVGEHRIRSVLAASLVIDGITVGSLNLHSVVSGRYNTRDLPTATAFAERVCQALRNARLYRAEQDRRRAAEELAQLRSDFLSTVSHELRTPLTAIVGFAELLRQRWQVMDLGRRELYMDRIVSSANRQLRLVEDLLETSRIEAGVLQCARVPIRLRTLLDRAAAEVETMYRGQRVDLRGPDDTVASGDAERVVQVLINLIDNAAKYSPEGSLVAVTWGLEEGFVIVRVRDHGPGIAAVNKPLLFTRFGRLPGSRSRSGRSGTGLGLYLSRLLAEVMGGGLCLEATGPRGSTFRLQLPCHTAVPAA